MSKIPWNDIKAAAERIGVEPCALQAVCEVEAAGNGFLPDGRPKILFEGHIFWKELKKAGLDPNQYAAANPDILYPKWTKAYYKGGVREYDRLEWAKKINREAALKSASCVTCRTTTGPPSPAATTVPATPRTVTTSSCGRPMRSA